MNLLSNAIKFTPCGEVTVTARVITSVDDLSVKDSAFENIIYPDKKYLEVQIKDTGVGIKPED